MIDLLFQAIKNRYVLWIVVVLSYFILSDYFYVVNLDGPLPNFRRYLFRIFLGTCLSFIMFYNVFFKTIRIFAIVMLLAPGPLFMLARRIDYVFPLGVISVFDINAPSVANWALSWVPLPADKVASRELWLPNKLDKVTAAIIKFPSITLLEKPWWRRPLKSSPKLIIDIQVAMSFQRLGSYLTLFSADRFNIQAVNNGVLFTAPRGDHDVKADFVNIDRLSTEITRLWEINLSQEYIAVKIDKKNIWSSDVNLDLTDLILGDSQNSPEHLGVICIDAAKITARLNYAR